MNKLVKRVLPIALSTLFLAGTVTVSAQSIGELKTKKSEIQKKTSEVRGALDQAKLEKNTLMEELLEMDLEAEELSAEIDFITDELAKTTEDLERAEADLEAATLLKGQQEEALIQRLRVMDENGALTYIQILFNSEDLVDFVDKLENIKTIAEYDRNLFSELEETERLIDEKVALIDQKKRETELLLSQQTAKMHALDESMSQKTQRVAVLESDEAGYLALIAENEKQSNEIAAFIRQEEAKIALQAAKSQAAKEDAAAKMASSYAYTGGRLGWPLPGYSKVSSGYVNRKSPITGRKEFHTGIDLPAPRGTNIVSAEKGVVIYAGWKNGYGNCVIVNHGSNLSTLYGHASKIVCSVGDQVERGTVIAKVGTTGQSTGNHLHFEVRISGNHQNPWEYLK